MAASHPNFTLNTTTCDLKAIVPGTVTLNVTPTLTWVPSNPQDVPLTGTVVVEETASATSSVGIGSPAPTITETADDGLKQQDPVIVPTPNAYGASCSGVLYTAVPVSAGQTSVPLPQRTVTVTLSWTGGGETSAVNMDASYTVSAPAITILPGGTYNPTAGDNRVLTGQHITATVQGLGGSVTKYAWSGQSGTCFKTYNEMAASNPLTPLASTDTSGPAVGSPAAPTLAFYDSKQEDLTLTCTATLLAPDNKTTLNITATSPKINVLKPTASWKVPSSGTFPFVNASGYGANVLWNPVTLTVPAPFNTGTGGLGCFAQLITPSRQALRTPPPGASKTTPSPYYCKFPDGKGGWTLASQGLDTAMPYQTGFVANPDGSPGTPVNGSSYTWNAIGGTGISGDMPTAPYSPPVVSGDTGGTDWSTATMTDLFTTWLMYQPPGGVWVPLQKLSWSTNVTVSSASGSWTLSSGSTVTTPPSGTDAADPPNWTCVNNLLVSQMRP